MFKNYLKIALRNLRQHKTYSFINLAGLAIGIACCVLMLLFIHEEFSYDRFHVNADSIYRVGNEGQFGNEIWKGARTPHPLAPALRAEFPEVQQAVRFYRLYQPADVLKSQWQSRPRGARPRQALVVVQFAISIIFVVSTMIVGAQLEFFRNKELGFNKEQVVALRIQDRSLGARYEAIKHELRQNANILSVAATSQLPGAGEGQYYYSSIHF